MLKVNTVWYHYEANKKYRKSGAWVDKPLYEFIEDNALRFPDKEAFIDDRRRISYGQFLKMARRLAFALYDLGIRSGDVVAIQGPNCVELPLTEIACDYLDALFMPLSDTWRETELRYLLNLAEIKAVLSPYIHHGFNYLELIHALKPDIPSLEHVILIGEEVPSGEQSLDEIFDTPLEEKYPYDFFEQFRPSGDSPRHLTSSSGTTGFPKVSCMSENNIYSLFVHHGCHTSIKLNPDDIVAAIAPGNTGATGYGFAMLAPLCIGATVAALKIWNPKKAIEFMEKEKCTAAVMIPTQAIKMLGEDVEKYDLRHFKTLFNGGAQFPVENIKEFERRFCCNALNAYGATDAGAPFMITVEDPEEKRWTTVGRCWDAELKIVSDDNGTEANRGQKGEIMWRGSCHMYGYLNNNQADRDAFTVDGFFKSGDVGFIDDEGYLHITGRIKEIIIRGGQNIGPREIEEILASHPHVLEVAVAAMPDTVLGERVCAFVTPVSGKSLTFDQMILFMESKRIAKWKLPERLEIMETIPKSAGGKIMKKRLTEMITEKLKSEGKLPPDFEPQVKV